MIRLRLSGLAGHASSALSWLSDAASDPSEYVLLASDLMVC
jgi:hypothetical protein